MNMFFVTTLPNAKYAFHEQYGSTSYMLNSQAARRLREVCMFSIFKTKILAFILQDLFNGI